MPIFLVRGDFVPAAPPLRARSRGPAIPAPLARLTRRARSLPIAAAALVLALTASPAYADGTFFFGYTPKPTARPARGFAVGFNMAVVGFEFEYSNTDKVDSANAPGLKTYMFNGLVMTPGSAFQAYATAGAGFYNEANLDNSDTSFGTNLGAGVKFRIAGPLRMRLDYRVFRLSDSAIEKTSQRFYAGANVAF